MAEINYLGVVIENLVTMFPPNATHLVASEGHARVKLVVCVHPACIRLLWS